MFYLSSGVDKFSRISLYVLRQFAEELSTERRQLFIQHLHHLLHYSVDISFPEDPDALQDLPQTLHYRFAQDR